MNVTEQTTTGKLVKTLPAGIRRIVNVDAPTLRENIESEKKLPMVRVRREDTPDQWETFVGVSINGPSSLFPTFDKPLVGTNGRGICYLVTDASIDCFDE